MPLAGATSIEFSHLAPIAAGANPFRPRQRVSADGGPDQPRWWRADEEDTATDPAPGPPSHRRIVNVGGNELCMAVMAPFPETKVCYNIEGRCITKSGIGHQFET